MLHIIILNLVIMNASKLIDILAMNAAYDSSKISIISSQGGTELIICPIENTLFTDVFVLTKTHQSKWKEMKTIKQALITSGINNLKIFRAFVFTTQLDDDVNGTGDDVVYRVGKNSSNELFLLKILDDTNFWL